MLFLYQGIFKRIPAKPNQALLKIFALSLAVLLFSGAYNQKEIDLVISNPTIINVENSSLTLHHDILMKGNTVTGIVHHRKKYDSTITVVRHAIVDSAKLELYYKTLTDTKIFDMTSHQEKN